jgi:hypothetical protein
MRILLWVKSSQLITRVRLGPSAEVVRDRAEQSFRVHRLELSASSHIGNPDVGLFINAGLAIEIDLDRRKCALPRLNAGTVLSTASTNFPRK